MADRGGRYQICGPSAFNRYGLSAQVPNRVYAYNNRLSGERTIGAITLTLIKVADARLGNTEESTTREGLAVTYSSRVRTLVDAVYDWARFGSLPRGYAWITSRAGCTAGDPRGARRMHAPATATWAPSVAWVRSSRGEGVGAALLRKLDGALPESTGTIPWIPTRPKRGTLDRRWGRGHERRDLTHADPLARRRPRPAAYRRSSSPLARPGSTLASSRRTTSAAWSSSTSPRAMRA